LAQGITLGGAPPVPVVVVLVPVLVVLPVLLVLPAAPAPPALPPLLLLHAAERTRGAARTSRALALKTYVMCGYLS
jgi:hypothetical protein